MPANTSLTQSGVLDSFSDADLNPFAQFGIDPVQISRKDMEVYEHTVNFADVMGPGKVPEKRSFSQKSSAHMLEKQQKVFNLNWSARTMDRCLYREYCKDVSEISLEVPPSAEELYRRMDRGDVHEPAWYWKDMLFDSL